MSYLARINALDFSRSSALPVHSRIALLTGQSSFRASRLSPAQADFLRAVAPPHAEPLLAAFPYHPDFDRAAPPPGLPAASVRNGLQFLWCLTSPAFRRGVARALQPVFVRTRDRLYLITGSCGLQLLAAAWPELPIPGGLRITTVAIGPALLRCFRLDPSLVSAVQGRSDLWSRLLYRGPIAARCHAGHLEHWQSAETRSTVARLLARSDA
jgi:hypothetical protein